MKLIQYIQYLKILQYRYGGNIEVKVDISYEDRSGEYHSEQVDAIKPNYDKNNKCVIIHYDLASND